MFLKLTIISSLRRCYLDNSKNIFMAMSKLNDYGIKLKTLYYWFAIIWKVKIFKQIFFFAVS